MSDEGTIKEKRINLGNIKFDNNVQRLGDDDIIYTIKEERTAFFRFTYDTQIVEKEKNSNCNAVSRDILKPRKGDIYLLVKLVNPQDGKSFVVRRKI
ncbi:hypothetical protein [Salibacter halophilus]|uniref:Uncharacterized protein n=1 Tax=Salibacter halophilus TaxID=1803916 RepID=A0A6N6MAD7_9FLAO|nr:hypothetical protein [Salibacter halophilus]KAB1065220.1 hypothetical protein F3059_04500 [Salibacter halophilus]